MAWFSFGGGDLAAELSAIKDQLRSIVTSIEQVRADYRGYAQELKDQRDAAIALAESNLASAQANAQALADFQANDAATDATQLAEKEAADAQAFADDLAALKAQDAPVEPTPEPAPEPTPEPTPEPAPEPAPEPTPEGNRGPRGKRH